eukprot:CAMPEP_0170232942 /NCGR_PEP_ID=MMETSP0116_2-20130129/16214_1 /TAXON_ID=400756 /ORGANISM="Durinskia baltica, Strain CSIRO CS-38" /LENGTH=63 /DNA_ID=CAMNT_0010483731 /DNA_START=294 /DNA_END=485 /DNA_ORIENTATION=+
MAGPDVYALYGALLAMLWVRYNTFGRPVAHGAKAMPARRSGKVLKRRRDRRSGCSPRNLRKAM